MNVRSGVIEAALVLIQAQSVHLEHALIDADAKGCLSEQGEGAAVGQAFCAGSGGSNGGEAGVGLAYSEKNMYLCKAP